MTITTRPTNGRLPKRTRERIHELLLTLENKQIEVTIKRKRKTRSNPQNAYYWGVVIPLLVDGIYNQWGEYQSKEQAHELLKERFCFNEVVNEDTGEVIKLKKSTTYLTTVEMEIYLEQCRQFLNEWFGITAPLPNEQLTI